MHPLVPDSSPLTPTSSPASRRASCPTPSAPHTARSRRCRSAWAVAKAPQSVSLLRPFTCQEDLSTLLCLKSSDGSRPTWNETPRCTRPTGPYPAMTPYVLSPQVLPTALLAAGEYARPLLLRCPPPPRTPSPGSPSFLRGSLAASCRPFHGHPSLVLTPPPFTHTQLSAPACPGGNLFLPCPRRQAA